MYSAVSSSSRRRPIFPPLPEDPLSDSFLRESEIIARDSSSSDDDTEKAAKRRRILKRAASYLRGEPLYIHSARLRGPVVKNPWGKAAKQVKRKNGGEVESEGGVRKKLKRYNIGEEEDGREILPTPQASKGKGILTSRGTNTIDDIVPEASTTTPLRIRSSTAVNVPDRSHSCSPISRVTSDRNHVSGLDRCNPPFDISRQTDGEVTMVSPFKTPGKRKPERSPIEVPPVCSPGTFYHRPPKPQNLTITLKSTTSHQSVGTSHTPPQEDQGSSSKSVRKTSARKNTKEQETVLNTIILAKPTSPSPDIDLKKKRLKIDFTTKSPFVKPMLERAKPSKGRKKKTSMNKEAKMDEPRPDLVPEVQNVSLERPENDVERVEDTSKSPEEQVLNDWVNRHVAASQSIRAQSGAFGSAPKANSASEESSTEISTILVETSIVLKPILDNTPAAAEPMETSEISTLLPEKALDRPADTITPQDTLQTLSLPETAAVSPPKPEPEKIQSPPPPDSDTATIPQPPTDKIQSPTVPEQAQQEVIGDELPLSDLEEQVQSQAVWQNTQYQVLAAQKGFFDALQDSPMFGPYASVETPGRDLLRPISFFDNEPGVKETPRPGGDRATNGESVSSSFKTPGFTGMSAQWSADRLSRDTFISPSKTTFGESGESLPGTAFTPFRAFATPESSPKLATARTLSPLMSSTLKDQTQQLNDSTKTVKFGGGGFGLLDDDEDEGEPTDGSFGGEFSPVGFREMGQQGVKEAGGLIEEVMDFMGGGVWDIDEELKKMAGSSANTPGGTPGTGRKGKGRECGFRKRRLYGSRA